MIQVFKPWIDEREIEAVTKVLESGWIGLGPKVAEFEQKFAEYVGAEHAVAMNSGTAALHLALLALGIGPGDEVLVPTITFVSTAHAVEYCGAKPVFVDVEADTLCLNAKDAERRMTKRTRAILPVHYAGHPCRSPELDAGRLRHLVGDRFLALIEDAAHASGTKFENRQLCKYKVDAICFSFHAVKNLTCGEGGMVTTMYDNIAESLRRLRWCGIDKSTWGRTEAIGDTRGEYGQYGWYYEVDRLGYKCHMSDINAAIGLVQLEKLKVSNIMRRSIVDHYQDAFSDLEWLERPVEKDYCKSSWHLYYIKLEKPEYRDRLNLFLRDRGIATGVHYMPLHLQPYYRDQGQPSLPVAEDVWRRILTLPLYPGLLASEVEQVIEGVREFGRML
jgi:perosamine synthetase